MFVTMDKLSEPVDSYAKSQAQNAPLKLGDNAIFYDENDKKMNGVVRWIGMNREIMESGTKIVGIETVTSY